MSEFESPNDCLQKAKEIIYQEIAKLAKKSSAKSLLEKVEAEQLNNYVKTLVLLNRDDREDAKNNSLPTATDEELKDLTKQALDFLATPKEKSDE